MSYGLGCCRHSETNLLVRYEDLAHLSQSIWSVGERREMHILLHLGLLGRTIVAVGIDVLTKVPIQLTNHFLSRYAPFVNVATAKTN